MAIVKCQNPQCDYFQKPVPEGDYCPFCGEPLPTKQSSSPHQPATPSLESPVFQAPITSHQPPTPSVEPPVFQAPITPHQQPTPSVEPPVFQAPITPHQPATPNVEPPVFQTPIPPIAQKPNVAPPPPPRAFPSPEDSPATVYEATPSRYPNLKLIHTSGKEFAVIIGQKAYIGRRGGQKKPQPEIDITDIPFSERVSRPHAHIFWDEQANNYMIVDNQSTNGTVMDGEALKPWHPYPLKNGAILELGKEHYVKFTISIR